MFTRQEEEKYCEKVISKFIDKEYDTVLILISKSLIKVKNIEKYNTLFDLSIIETGEIMQCGDMKFLLTYDNVFYSNIKQIIDLMLCKYLSDEFISNYKNKNLNFLVKPLVDKSINKLSKEKTSELLILYKLRR